MYIISFYPYTIGYLALYTPYFPEFCERIPQANHSGGVPTLDPCIAMTRGLTTRPPELAQWLKSVGILFLSKMYSGWQVREKIPQAYTTMVGFEPTTLALLEQMSYQ